MCESPLYPSVPMRDLYDRTFTLEDGESVSVIKDGRTEFRYTHKGSPKQLRVKVEIEE